MSKLIPHHPLADLLPMVTGEEFDNFAADIKANGLRRPILTTKIGGKTVIADGRTRQMACEAAGIKPRFEEWDGKGSLLDIICSLNVRQRTLSKTDRAVAAEAAIEHAANLQLGREAETLAAKFDVSARYVYQVRAIRKASPKIYALLRARKTQLTHAVNLLDRSRRERAVVKAAAKIDSKCAKIIIGDCVAAMNKMVAGSATVIFADPPYNNRWKYDGDLSSDDLPDGEYLDWCEQWMTSAARVLSPNGSMFVLIDDKYNDHFGIILRRLGLHRRNTIVWWETFGTHQRGNFSRCARYVHYYTANPKGFIWHPEPVESERQRMGDPRANPDGKCPDNVWAIPRIVGNHGDRVPFEDAPPQLPDELPLRCILAASEPGDTVLDPFNGNGTTGRAALLAGRKYIGIDRSAKYAKQSEQWIHAALASKEVKNAKT
jgi:adenine-specific DNA-methyltransferase